MSRFNKKAVALVDSCVERVEIERFSKSKLGIKMRNLRNASGLSVREMSRRLGFSPTYISNVELGKRGISIDNLSRFIEECFDEV